MRLLTRRIVQLVVVLFLLTVVSFASIRLLPGDPAVVMGGLGADRTKIEQIRVDLGLREPIYEQYGKWLGNFVQGDLGKYYNFAGDPTNDLKDALPISLQLMLY